jgi:hypothetical protein
MRNHPDYELELSAVERFLEASRISGYHFDRILFGGGEPLLWDPLPDAVELVASRGITKSIWVLTNGTQIRERPEVVRRLKGLCKLKVNPPKRKHWQLPKSPIPGTLPADCRCQHYSLLGDFMEVCGPARFILEGLNESLDDYPNYVTSISPGWLKRLGSLDRYNCWWCAYCVSNLHVRKAMPKRARK